MADECHCVCHGGCHGVKARHIVPCCWTCQYCHSRIKRSPKEHYEKCQLYRLKMELNTKNE
jgi:hypothetical protein